MKKVSVSTPASTANLGAGFDCLGLALNLRNVVELWDVGRGSGLEIDIEGEGEDRLPTDSSNLIARAAERVFAKVGKRPAGLLRLHAINGVPLSSGLGSSAATIVGGLVAANALALCVLGLYRTTSAEPRETNLPFANAVEQRAEMIEQLREIGALLKEQNALLSSGKLKVVVDPGKR